MDHDYPRAADSRGSPEASSHSIATVPLSQDSFSSVYTWLQTRAAAGAAVALLQSPPDPTHTRAWLVAVSKTPETV